MSVFFFNYSCQLGMSMNQYISNLYSQTKVDDDSSFIYLV